MAPRVIRLDLAYDGTDFRGWAAQRDPGVRTIEGELVRTLERVLRERPRLSVAGRTDAGVHARGQVASFTTERALEPERIGAALNGALAPEVVVTAASAAPDGFDARKSATERRYRYTIDLAEVPDPFTARYVWHRPEPLALAPMRSAARHLVGEHDFTSFCRHPGDGRSTVRDVRGLIVRRADRHLEIAIRANAFLHQMVRSIVGTLVVVGERRIDADDIPGILAARDRAAAGPVAPAVGLTLERVIYGRRPGSGPVNRSS
jgi:tRNA pseudouridine38-40 synthase